jgi:hypothetical protein
MVKLLVDPDMVEEVDDESLEQDLHDKDIEEDVRTLVECHPRPLTSSPSKHASRKTFISS